MCIPYSEKQINSSNICLSFGLGNIFSRGKTNMDEDKKENFRTEIVKKGLVFATIQYAVLKFTYN